MIRTITKAQLLRRGQKLARSYGYRNWKELLYAFSERKIGTLCLCDEIHSILWLLDSKHELLDHKYIDEHGEGL